MDKLESFSAAANAHEADAIWCVPARDSSGSLKNEKKMEINRIETAADHTAALKEIEGLMAAELGTPERNRLNVLAAQVQAYEAQNFSTELTKPIDASELENHEHPDLAASPRAPSQHGDPLEARQSRRVVALIAAEGLWTDRTDIPKDGVKYQNQLRGEWD